MIEPGLWDMIMRLRSRGISDAGLTRALELCPRSRFVQDEDRDRAYDEVNLPLPCGQIMLPPLLTAQLLQIANLSKDHKVLVVGLGSGWLAGLVSRMSRSVYAIERYQQLLAFAEANLARAGIRDSVTARWGDGRYGWKANAPFDRIIVTAGLSKPPKALLSQLASDGVMAAVIDGQLGSHNTEAFTPILPVDIPPLEAGKSAAL